MTATPLGSITFQVLQTNLNRWGMNHSRKASFSQAVLLLLGSCLPILGAVLLAPVLPKIQQHFHDHPMATVLVPVSLTLPALMIAIFSPFAGLIADKFGRKNILLLAMAAYGILGTMPLWLDSLEAIVFSRAGLGITEAAIMTCCTTLMGDYYSGKRRERLLSFQTVVTSLAAAIFIALGGLIGQDNWKAPFWLYSCAFLFMPLMAISFWEPNKPDITVTKPSATTIPWGHLTPDYFLTFIAGICLFIVPVQASYLLNLIAVTDPAKIGLTMGFNQVGMLAGAALFQGLPNHLRISIIKASLLLISLGVLLMGLAQQHLPLTIAVTLIGLGVGLLVPNLITCVMSFVDLEQRGRVTGVFTATLFFGEFISPVAVLTVTKGNTALIPQALYIIAGALFAILCAIVLPLMRLTPPIVKQDIDYEVSQP